MFLFGENQPAQRRLPPEVHDSDGLMVWPRARRMAVAPAAKPRQVLVTSFATTNPRVSG